MTTLKILINKLIANYSSNCNFKIKIISSSTPNKESTENKHSVKYIKGTSEVNINETLDLVLNQPLSSDLKLQFFLEVYTKTGYKTAGVGILNLSSDISSNVPIKIEIQKCPLGKGTLEVQFENYNLSNSIYKPSPSPPSSQINMYTNQSSKKQNNYSIINNSNNDIIREKDLQISELKTKIEYFEQENNELKGLVNDFKKEKRKLMEEKNMQLSQQKEQIQKLMNEKDDIQMELMSLQQNMNLLQSNKNNTDQKVLDMKNQSDKQIKDLMQQIRNLTNLKSKLETDNKTKEETIINLERKNKEISINYQRKLNEMGNNFSSEKNNTIMNHSEQLKSKEEEIVKLNIKIRSLEENIQSLNEEIEINNRKKIENDESTKTKRKLLEQLSSKDEQIFDLKKEISNLKNKILTESNNRKTQTMLNGINEKELKSKISELQILLNDKEEEILELQEKYDNLKYESKRLKPKLKYVNIDDEEGGDDNGNNSNFLNQLKEMQKTYKEREEKLIREKNEEIKKLRIRNQSLERESNLYNNDKSTDIRKYLNEIKKLKNINNNLEDDLKYYKELNNKYVENEKRNTTYESENLKLQNLIQKKDEEIEEMLNQQKKMEEENRMLERQLINSKGKLGEVLNELAEVESKCVYLEQNQLKKNEINGQSD